MSVFSFLPTGTHVRACCISKRRERERGRESVCERERERKRERESYRERKREISEELLFLTVLHSDD